METRRELTRKRCLATKRFTAVTNLLRVERISEPIGAVRAMTTVEKTMRFAIKRDRLARPFLSLFGGTSSKSYVEVEPASVRVRFGPFDERIPREEIIGAARSKWSLLGGVGWRLVSDGVALIGSTSDVVCVKFANRRRVHLLPLISVRASRLYVSVDQPEAFIAALSITSQAGNER
jgi:hypothetical protein